MNLKEQIHNLITKALIELGYPEETVVLNHPESDFGDYSTNVALILARKLAGNPKEVAEEIKKKIIEFGDKIIKNIEVAGPGFINFYLAEEVFVDLLNQILIESQTFGQTKKVSGKKIMLEYTDTNPFKEFHIGHLMSNTVGESLSRLFEINGAEVKRACYQGDVGLHVAKALWGMYKLESDLPKEETSLSEKIKFLGQAYALGSVEYEDGTSNAKEGIVIINKKIYKRSDPKLNELYDLGRRWSLEHFETVYSRLGTKFDFYFFESETWALGQKIVEDGLAKGIFEKSEGAIVFHGEKYNSKLHTRVFINSEGVTTYEAKDLGLAKLKSEKYPFDLSFSITASEQLGYFQVLIEAIRQALPDIAEKIKHLSHGMLRLPTGKMSSRTGDIITAEYLIDEVKQKVNEKIKDRDLSPEEKLDISEKVAIGAIKYSILKQATDKDIIFDFDRSLSFEGDSGPYLQYTYTRALSVLRRVGEVNGEEVEELGSNSLEAKNLSRLLYQLPEVIEAAYVELAPQYVASYLIEVASAFNSFYAKNKIVGSVNEKYFLSLTEATTVVLKNGLNVLGIPVLERM